MVRGSSYGDPIWRAKTVKKLGLEATLRPAAAPQKSPKAVVKKTPDPNGT